MSLYRLLSTTTLFLLALSLSACPGDEETPQSVCDEIECGENSYCDEELEECVCEAGFIFFEDSCVNRRVVTCRDAAPENARSSVEEIEINWTPSDGWGHVPECEWSCNADYDLWDGECIDQRDVDCNDVSPENGTSTVIRVQTTYTDEGGWSEIPDCEWACDPDFEQSFDTCRNTQMVPCDASSVPSNASAVVEEVEIDYTDADGWSDPSACQWACNAGFGEHQGACLASRTVACRNVAPDNATSEFLYLTIQWDEDAGEWPEAPECAWTCNTGYGEHEDLCLNSVEVACRDNPPANAETTDPDALVTITWNPTTQQWSPRARCPWACVADYDLVQGQCINSRAVNCDASGTPENATADITGVEITYTDAEGWSDPQACVWSCISTHGEHPSLPGECHDVLTVDCMDESPANSTLTSTTVEIHWSESEVSWTSALCPWECIDVHHAEDGSCVPNRSIGWCNLQWPHEIADEYIHRPFSFFGQVWVDGQTGQSDRLSGISAALCFGTAPLSEPIDLSSLDCVPAAYSFANGNNDEYEAVHAFELPGEYEYIFAFSGDGGESWLPCLLDGSSGREGEAGLASIFGPENGDFEDWEDDGTGEMIPVGWTGGTDVAVELEETDVQGGNHAVRLTRIGSSNSQTEFSAGLSPVTAGVDYDIDMWFLDNDPNARGRHVFEWLDQNLGIVGDVSWGDFTSDGPDWQLYSVRATAPEGAAYVRVYTRIYTQTDGMDTGGSVVLDSVIVRPVAYDCQDQCLLAGETRCDEHGLVIESCLEQADGCLDWSATTDCADSGDVCDDSEGPAVCVTPCVDQCAAEDAHRCNGTEIEACVEQADGCLDWSVTIDCADSGDVCDDSEGPAVCILVCPAGEHETGGICVPDLVIGWCNLQHPDLTTMQVGVPGDFYGRVWVDGVTGQGSALPSITAKWCSTPAPMIDPDDLDALDCQDADFNISDGNDDEYMILNSFADRGSYEYIFAFSGDGGESWTSCMVSDSGSTRIGMPGLAEVDASPPNGELELWSDDGAGSFEPEDWTWGSHLEVEREDTIVHRGDHAARLTRIGNDNGLAEFSASISPVMPGIDYQIDMWFFDDDPSARANVILEWLDATMTTIGSVSYGGTYTVDSPEWQLIRREVTSPAEAIYLRVATRVYGDPDADTTGGSIVVDSVVNRPDLGF